MLYDIYNMFAQCVYTKTPTFHIWYTLLVVTMHLIYIYTYANITTFYKDAFLQATLRAPASSEAISLVTNMFTLITPDGSY